MEAAALHQAQCRLLVARASRRLLLRGVWSLRLTHYTRLRRGSASWHGLATTESVPPA